MHSKPELSLPKQPFFFVFSNFQNKLHHNQHSPDFDFQCLQLGSAQQDEPKPKEEHD